MQLVTYIILILGSITLVYAGRTTTIKPVRFIRTNRRTDSSTPRPSQRSARSYGGVTVDVTVWTERTIPFVYEKPNPIAFNVEDNGHITPDFSNGLAYPDPLLLTGLPARRAVRYLYSKELFFGDIPHIKALLRNQEVRRANGLSSIPLGSLRPPSPFYRFKKDRRFQNYL